MTAQKLLDDGVFEKFVAERYASYDSGVGQDIVSGKADFKFLEEDAMGNSSIENSSGLQEYLETILNEYLLSD